MVKQTDTNKLKLKKERTIYSVFNISCCSLNDISKRPVNTLTIRTWKHSLIGSVYLLSECMRLYLFGVLCYLVYHLQNYSEIFSCFVTLNRNGLRLEPWGTPGHFLL